MMMLQIMIVKNGLMRMNDQYPRSPRQTIRTTRTTSSSLDTPNFGDRSSSFTAAVLFEGPLSVLAASRSFTNPSQSLPGRDFLQSVVVFSVFRSSSGQHSDTR